MFLPASALSRAGPSAPWQFDLRFFLQKETKPARMLSPQAQSGETAWLPHSKFHGAWHMPLNPKQTLPTLQANLPTLKRKLPTLKENLPTLKRMLPTLQANLPTLKRNLPTLQANLPTLKRKLPTLKAKPPNA